MLMMEEEGLSAEDFHVQLIQDCAMVLPNFLDESRRNIMKLRL
jgi:hypothetical protein